MNTIEEACDKIREYLTQWYIEHKSAIVKTCTPYAQYLNGSYLYDAKQKFIELNPKYKKFDFYIHTGFDVDGDTWQPGCLDGCCQTRAKVRGIYVVPIDWKQARNLALKKSRTLAMISRFKFMSKWVGQ
jgi:hypothetical protein